MFCSKCGSKIDEKLNFCGKCGTKVDKATSSTTKAGSSTNANNLDSFIGNISKKTDKQSVDSDIFTKVDEAENVNNKNIKKRKSWFQELFSKVKKTKAKPKRKPKPKQKQKPRPKQKSKQSSNASRKNINMKILIPAILAPVIIAAGVFVFMFFKGKISNPNNDIVKAFQATLVQIEKHAEKTKLIPDFSINKAVNSSSDKDTESKIFEKEQYLKIKNAKGGLLNEDILGSLKGLSVKLSEKQDVKEDLFNTRLTFANDKNEEIFAELYSSPELVTLKLPSLYHSDLGMHFRQDNNSDTDNAAVPDISTPYYDEVTQLFELLKNGESSFNIFKDSIKEKSGAFVNDIIKNAEFTLVSENEQSKEKEYSTIIENTALLESLKAFLTQIKEDDFNKKLQFLLSYFIKGETLELAEFITIGSTDMLIAGIDNTIQELTPKEPEKAESEEPKEAGVTVGEIAKDTAGKVAKMLTDEVAKDDSVIVPKETEIRLVTNEKQTIRSISFSIVIDGVLVSTKIDIEESENTLNLKANVKMSKNDSYLTLDIMSLTEELSADEIKRGNTISLTTFLDDKIVFDSYDTYNSKTNIYNNKVDISVNDKSGEFLVDYDLSGKYKEENDSKKLDIDSLKIDMNDGLYKFNLEFIGHILKQSSNSMDIINPNNVVFIDNMSDQETNGIKEEINKNWKEFLERFRNRKW